METPHPTLLAPGGDLPQRTGVQARHDRNNSYQKTERLAACLVCASHKDKGHLTIKDWLREIRREGDPHEPIVKAFRAARKAAEASLAA